MNSHRYALLVGSWDYQSDQIPSRTAPRQDVQSLAAVLKDPRIGSFEDVEVLENKTAREIGVALEKFYSGRSIVTF
ncbi:hypothetical protein SAMN05446927_4267 [Caballeronia arationis]|uniref:Peptidase C14 caspase domain-containing protein n=1 Tax=Caballeronia arationis TaxID=1777142 RepID=A0A7Z7N4C7_9BURK|nr:caspase family protein [Caballeronia arationis]SOE81013.1 hypothetical protein SAMN05446927_4267 [Caballeronia arationis]